MLDGAAVHVVGALRVKLAGVHVGPSGAVDDRSGPRLVEGRIDRRLVRDVEPRVVEGEDLSAARLRLRDDRAPDHPARAQN